MSTEVETDVRGTDVRKHWHARVRYPKYVGMDENVPVNSIKWKVSSKLNGKRTYSPYQPSDVKDFGKDQLYAVKSASDTNDKQAHEFYAYIGRIAESLEALISSLDKDRISWTRANDGADSDPETSTEDDPPGVGSTAVKDQRALTAARAKARRVSSVTELTNLKDGNFFNLPTSSSAFKPPTSNLSNASNASNAMAQPSILPAQPAHSYQQQYSTFQSSAYPYHNNYSLANLTAHHNNFSPPNPTITATSETIPVEPNNSFILKQEIEFLKAELKRQTERNSKLETEKTNALREKEAVVQQFSNSLEQFRKEIKHDIKETIRQEVSLQMEKPTSARSNSWTTLSSATGSEIMVSLRPTIKMPDAKAKALMAVEDDHATFTTSLLKACFGDEAAFYRLNVTQEYEQFDEKFLDDACSLYRNWIAKFKYDAGYVEKLIRDYPKYLSERSTALMPRGADGAAFRAARKGEDKEAARAAWLQQQKEKVAAREAKQQAKAADSSASAAPPPSKKARKPRTKRGTLAGGSQDRGVLTPIVNVNQNRSQQDALFQDAGPGPLGPMVQEVEDLLQM